MCIRDSPSPCQLAHRSFSNTFNDRACDQVTHQNHQSKPLYPLFLLKLAYCCQLRTLRYRADVENPKVRDLGHLSTDILSMDHIPSKDVAISLPGILLFITCWMRLAWFIYTIQVLREIKEPVDDSSPWALVHLHTCLYISFLLPIAAFVIWMAFLRPVANFIAMVFPSLWLSLNSKVYKNDRNMRRARANIARRAHVVKYSHELGDLEDSKIVKEKEDDQRTRKRPSGSEAQLQSSVANSSFISQYVQIWLLIKNFIPCAQFSWKSEIFGNLNH
eukprot:TRINITY_DN8791_c0_g1_i5.p1 TRINITY_DN8791_c0_g1~~TRINITY_DN8791_c0_g1_i5.p1  ORF type:complete len:298 (+),score=18.42 TRINITY_DN8791_c0_g1_i5:72-896(+)